MLSGIVRYFRNVGRAPLYGETRVDRQGYVDYRRSGRFDEWLESARDSRMSEATWTKMNPSPGRHGRSSSGDRHAQLGRWMSRPNKVLRLLPTSRGDTYTYGTGNVSPSGELSLVFFSNAWCLVISTPE